MNEKLTREEILESYPLLYDDKNAPASQTAMCFGIECGDGWLPLINELSTALEKEIQQYIEDYPDLDCENCWCPIENHYGSASDNPGKCLTVHKVPTRHKWKSKRIFKFRPKWLAKIFTLSSSILRKIENKILDFLFWRYLTCWCEQYRHPHPRAFQVKSKYGELRFYMTCATNEMENLIKEAEKKSVTICEECGKPGERRGGAWIVTLCDECEKKRGNPEGCLD